MLGSIRSFLALILFKKPKIIIDEARFLLKDSGIQVLFPLAVCFLLASIPIENVRWGLALIGIILLLITVLLAVKVRTEQSVYVAIDQLGPRAYVFLIHLAARQKAGLYDGNSALEVYQKALNLGGIPSLSDLYGIILHDMAACHVMLGNKSAALTKLDQAMRAYENEDTASRLGQARVQIARMNAYVYFGECSGSLIDDLGEAERCFLAGLEICSPQDPVVLFRDKAYSKRLDLQAMKIFDAYGASKAHCQYSWALLANNTEKALWHATVAHIYSKMIKDSEFSEIWGLRDGAVGSYWRESLALFTIADCHTILDDLEQAEAAYKEGHSKIVFNERKWYFMGHYWWLYLCKRGRIEQARKWLKEALDVATRDEYQWYIALTHFHLGELEQFFCSSVHHDLIEQEYKTALNIAHSHNLGSLYSTTRERLINPHLRSWRSVYPMRIG